MINNINKIIKESKDNGFKPRYLVLNYLTKNIIPFKINTKGEEIYKGLKIITFCVVPDNIIYLHRYKPKL